METFITKVTVLEYYYFMSGGGAFTNFEFYFRKLFELLSVLYVSVVDMTIKLIASDTDTDTVQEIP